MSLASSVAYVPEMLLNAPHEVKETDVVMQIKKCVGVAFVRMYRLGCIVTVRGGSGVVFRKREDGSWSAPSAITMLGPAIGASIGLQMTDMILFFMTEDALKGFASGSMTVGANGSLAAGPLGREGEAMIGSGVKNGIMAFSSTQGLYGGVSIEFSGVLVDKTANQVQYGQPVSSDDILDKQAPPQGEVFDKAYKALKEMEMVPAAAAAQPAAAQPAAAQPAAATMTKA